MDIKKLTEEAKKAQFLAGIITENENIQECGMGAITPAVTPEEQLSEEVPAEAQLTPEVQAVVDRVNEIMSGLNYKLNIQPYGVDLRYQYWRRLPLGILGALKQDFDVYQDDDQGDEEVRKTEYQIRPYVR